jgi:hypothetical protein
MAEHEVANTAEQALTSLIGLTHRGFFEDNQSRSGRTNKEQETKAKQIFKRVSAVGLGVGGRWCGG